MGRTKTVTPSPSDEPDAHVPSHQKAYVCTHVFDGERDVLLVSRPDGDWCLLCGGDHPDDPSSYRVVGIGHFLDQDPRLREVLDLDANEEAERSRKDGPWARSRF